MFTMFSVFGTICFLGYLWLRSRNQERLALIEKGVDASIFVSRKRGISLTLRIALLAMGIGVGVLLASAFDWIGMEEGVAYPAMILVGGGFGLLVAYLVDERKRKGLPEETS